MSTFEGEINRLRDEIEAEVKAIPGIIDTYSLKLSDIKSRLEMEVDREKLRDDLYELRSLRHQVKREAARTRHNLIQGLHEVRDKIKSSGYEIAAGESGETSEDMSDKLEKLDDYFEDKLDEIRDKLDSFSDRVEEVEEKVKDRIGDWRREMKDIRRDYISNMPEIKIPFSVPAISMPEIKIPNVGKVIEESLSRAWTGVPSAIVSSVRLPQADLSLIDTLANAGIFKSRNEGIAFFAHRGIEASEDWLTKVKEKLNDIKKLQEETKREIEKVVGGSTQSPTPSPTPKNEGEQGEEEGEV